LRRKVTSDHLLLLVDLLGTFLFAVEGGMTAAHHHLDLLGVMVLAFVTALGGGIVRDLLLGQTPPASMRNWRYPLTAFGGGFAVICFYRYVAELPGLPLLTLDAAGLGLFAVAGSAKALEFRINPLIAVLLGGLTGVGGGTIRDLLLAQVPGILRSDIYAAAALLGAAVVVAGILSRRFKPAYWMFAGWLVCFLLRMISLHQHWNLPVVATR
jgi:uncharacterized membrane protein YeiH